jgi:hypothetical protein
MNNQGIKFAALIRRSQQISPDDWEVWTEAFEIEENESVRSVYARIKTRVKYDPQENKIVPLIT